MNRNTPQAQNQIGSGAMLHWGFASIILVLIMLAVFSLHQLQNLQQEMSRVVETNTTRMDLTLQMRVNSRERVYLLFNMINVDDPFERDELSLRLMELGEKFLQTREALLATGLSDKERQMLEAHREHARTVVPLQRHVLELIQQDQIDEARRVLLEKAIPEQNVALKALDQIIEYQQQQAQRSMHKARKYFDRAVTIMTALTIGGVILSISIATLVSRRHGRMLAALRKAHDELEERVADRTRELMQANDRLEHLASYDTLTGLANRNLFYERLKVLLGPARRRKTMLALLFIDLDGFKTVNDTWGHDYGDELLRQVAKRLTEGLRNEDVVARLGGDEFTVILPDISGPEDAAKVADKVIRLIGEPFHVMDAECHIGCSIGIALYPLHTDNMETLVKYADDMMYSVKREGKNSFRVFEPK
jgi:diguanylate cyclase (GGDEF)-like protein